MTDARTPPIEDSAWTERTSEPLSVGHAADRPSSSGASLGRGLAPEGAQALEKLRIRVIGWNLWAEQHPAAAETVAKLPHALINDLWHALQRDASPLRSDDAGANIGGPSTAPAECSTVSSATETPRLVPNGGDSGHFSVETLDATLDNWAARLQAEPESYKTICDQFREMARRFAEDRDRLKHENRTLLNRLEAAVPPSAPTDPEGERRPPTALDNDLVMARSIVDLLARDEITGLNLPGVARLFRRLIEAAALPRSPAPKKET